MSDTAQSVQSMRIGLIAGEGELPVRVAENARDRGASVVSLSVSSKNRTALAKVCDGAVHAIQPGMVETNLALLRKEAVKHIVFAGKVNKWILLKHPQLDQRAVAALKEVSRFNDDDVMLWLVNSLESEGFQVLNQTAFLRDLFLPAGVCTKAQPTERDRQDIKMGFNLAKTMGGLDIGQTVTVKHGMVLAVEAIEGSDECIKRAGKWSKRSGSFLGLFGLNGKQTGGVVVKVEKPGQDPRFDVPTVGLRTLKTMRKAGLNVLATEANKTFYLEPQKMKEYANEHGMVMVSVTEQEMLEGQADVC
ncbi:MAG: UDP-2,3-diacylglucosamine diphosphatase LpxI [Vampirovibrio sp.]|nr:UDP-2,3-diacylglucosamine diphosphatase LpxI [Vampirovibrio sp.]